MLLIEQYSFNNGQDYINSRYPHLLKEILSVIENVDAESCRLKDPKGNERARLLRIGETKLYSPFHLNALFDYHLHQRGWELKPRINTHDVRRQGFREMDGIKEQLGIEIQFGKYAFLTYDIIAKMVIFKNFHQIDAGIEICPMASMLPHLSSGIGAFEQVKWDLIHRGAATELDVPVLLLGVATEKTNPERELQPTSTDNMPDPAVVIRNRESELKAKTFNRLRETGLDI